MKFMFDECVSFRIANALKELGKDADPYFKHWHRGAEDTDWIPLACSRGWCIVTSDTLRRPHERAALRVHGARIIVLGTRNLSLWEQVKLIINRWEDIEHTATKKRPPFIYRFTKRSRKPQQLKI